ncbi:hypothetical protein TNCV_4369051 [Trichonephila clavipes]|nr:hypothetical protein TNCV_4369051 [Trichonephila clavipes]
MSTPMFQRKDGVGGRSTVVNDGFVGKVNEKLVKIDGSQIDCNVSFPQVAVQPHLSSLTTYFFKKDTEELVSRLDKCLKN